MDYPNSLFLVKYQNNYELIIRESEAFDQMIRSLRLKCYVVLRYLHKLYQRFPQIFDFVSYLIFRVSKIN